jgi:subtilisin-like proprotein convertase family protein
MLSSFNGMDPNGQWTLFIADTSAGGEGTLVNWGMQITTVPEPSMAALIAVFGFSYLLKKRYTRG